MDRLTDKAWRNLDPWECCGQDRYCMRGSNDMGGCRGGCIVPKLYSRLAVFEDIGMEPERLKELVTIVSKMSQDALEHTYDLLLAELDGRLIVLPCKVGDIPKLRSEDGRRY